MGQVALEESKVWVNSPRAVTVTLLEKEGQRLSEFVQMSLNSTVSPGFREATVFMLILPEVSSVRITTFDTGSSPALVALPLTT